MACGEAREKLAAAARRWPAFREYCPTACMLDALMPGMDGFAAPARSLRHLPAASQVPVLAAHRPGDAGVDSPARRIRGRRHDFFVKSSQWTLLAQAPAPVARLRMRRGEMEQAAARPGEGERIARSLTRHLGNWNPRSDPPGGLSDCDICRAHFRRAARGEAPDTEKLRHRVDPARFSADCARRWRA